MVYCMWKSYKHFTVIKYVFYWTLPSCNVWQPCDAHACWHMYLDRYKRNIYQSFFGHCNFIYTNLSSRMLSWALVLRTRSRNSMSYNVPRTHLVLPLQQGHALPCPQRRTRYVRSKGLADVAPMKGLIHYNIFNGLVVESLDYSQSDGSEPAFPWLSCTNTTSHNHYLISLSATR